MSPRLRTASEALLAILLFGVIPVIVKSIAANAYTIGIVRLVIASIGIYAVVLLRRERLRVPPADVIRLVVIGALFFGHWLSYFLAIKMSSASIGAIGLSTYGVHLLILGAAFGGSRLYLVDMLAVLVATAGAVLVLPQFDVRNNLTGGMLLAVFSAFLYAILPILHQRWSHISTAVRTLGQFSVACFLFLLFLPKSNWDLSPRDWTGLIVLGVGSTLIAHTLWVRVTTTLTPALTSIIYYGSVPLAVILGPIFLDEPLTPKMILGAALVIIGSIAGLTHQWYLRRRLVPATDRSRP